MADTLANLKEYIKRYFGEPLQTCELSDNQLNDCIDDARRWFVNWYGVIAEMPLDVLANVNVYVLPNYVDDVLSWQPGISSVDLRVLFASFNFLDEQIPYDLFRVPQAGGVYSSFAQTISYVDMVKRIMSSDQDYEFERDTHRFFVFPPPRHAFHVALTYKSTEVDLETLDPRNDSLFRRYTLAKAKERLGILRSKFGGNYPLAGGKGELDGKELKAEAKEEIEKLDAEIIGMGGPMGIIVA